MSLENQFVLLHHCKRHDVYDPNCKKCIWWSKHNKCQQKKPFDKDAIFKSVVQYYLGKNYTKEQANERAQVIVAREMQRQGLIA